MAAQKAKYETRYLDPGDYALWDRFVLESPHGSLFSTTGWANVISDVFKRCFEILVLTRNDEIRAGILLWPKTGPGIRALTLVPATAYQGIIFAEPASVKPSSRLSDFHERCTLVLDELLTRYNMIHISQPPGTDDIRPFLWKGFSSEPRYTYRFPIRPYTELEQQFSQALRRKISRPAGDNYTVSKVDDPEALTVFLNQSYRFHHITPPVGADRIRLLMTRLIEEKIGHLYYLQDDTEPVAGLFLAADEKTVYALFSGIDARRRNRDHTEFLHTAVLKNPDWEGRIFDFLGANTETFEQFKRSFGGELVSYHDLAYYRNRTIRLLGRLREMQHMGKRLIMGKIG